MRTVAAFRDVVAGYRARSPPISCTEKTRHDPPDPALLAQIVLKHAPTPEHVLDVRFDDKVRLVGYDLAQPLVQPERAFKVTWYWSVQAPLGTGYQVFTHLSDGKINRLNLDANRALRRAYPEASWKAGDFLKDEQEITLPRDWKSEQAVFYVGFYSGEVRAYRSRKASRTAKIAPKRCASSVGQQLHRAPSLNPRCRVWSRAVSLARSRSTASSTRPTGAPRKAPARSSTP